MATLPTPVRGLAALTAVLLLLATGCQASPGDAAAGGGSTQTTDGSGTSGSDSSGSAGSGSPDTGPTADTDRASVEHPVPMRRFRADERPPQFILDSFDGCYQNAKWPYFTTQAAESDAHFTVFLSGIHLLATARRTWYQAPGNAPGTAAWPGRT